MPRYRLPEIAARDDAFLSADGMTVRDGRLWNEAWEAARTFYVANDEFPLCPRCGQGRYSYKSPGETEVWTCGHAVGK